MGKAIVLMAAAVGVAITAVVLDRQRSRISIVKPVGNPILLSYGVEDRISEGVNNMAIKSVTQFPTYDTRFPTAETVLVRKSGDNISALWDAFNSGGVDGKAKLKISILYYDVYSNVYQIMGEPIESSFYTVQPSKSVTLGITMVIPTLDDSELYAINLVMLDGDGVEIGNYIQALSIKSVIDKAIVKSVGTPIFT